MLNSLAPKGRFMPAPGVMNALNLLAHPFASSAKRDALNEEYAVAHSLDAFTHSEDPKERAVAEAGLKLYDAVKEGDLPSHKARYAMEQVQIALQAGLPSGPVGCILGQIGSKALESTYPIRGNYYDEDFRNSAFVAKSFLHSMEQTDSGFRPLAEQAHNLSWNQDRRTKITVLGAALTCGARDGQWTQSKATALVALESLPKLDPDSYATVAVPALASLSSTGDKFAQKTLANYSERRPGHGGRSQGDRARLLALSLQTAP